MSGYVYPPPEPRLTSNERAYERLKVAADSLHAALGVLEGWEPDFGSRSINEAVWDARDKLKSALDSLPSAWAALAAEPAAADEEAT